jgi:phage tail sheath gpL-like
MLANGSFLLSFSEEEVASVIDAAIADADSATETDMPLHNTHVNLDENIVLYMQTNSGVVNASGIMTLHPFVDSDGQLIVQVESAEFGRASFEDAFLDQIAAAVATALTAPADGLPVAVVLASATVTDEQLILTGYIVE